jgi:hypothetical protein
MDSSSSSFSGFKQGGQSGDSKSAEIVKPKMKDEEGNKVRIFNI